ncbi:hypothetical protein I6N96_04210 [Enterococcus sp. BWM-S5]|uniref:DUF1310 family protein n=1 Tax=Enterococcus larvae TaxID=2794352 RepID=A0ABS4CFR5_9ENTE|nr:hypothetical protein [Enterococcus larvae]MBP1045468.1 hypothetical protein [Enterococcus larvae]
MKKKIVIGVMIICLLLIGIGGKLNMDRKDKLAQIVEWERVVAGQIKNTFENVEEIKFSEKFVLKPSAGFHSMGVKIKILETDYEMTVKLPPVEQEERLSSYAYTEGMEKGITEGTTKVIYTDGSEEDI